MKPSLLPQDLDGTPAIACRDCGYLVFWGVTKTGKHAPFNEQPPHILHPAVCPARRAAAKRLRARKASNGKAGPKVGILAPQTRHSGAQPACCQDALAALTLPAKQGGLGYGKREAQAMLARATGDDTESLIRSALQAPPS